MNKSEYIKTAKIKLKSKGYKLTYPRFQIKDLDDEYIEKYLDAFLNKLQNYDNISVEGISVILSVLCDKCKA